MTTLAIGLSALAIVVAVLAVSIGAVRWFESAVRFEGDETRRHLDDVMRRLEWQLGDLGLRPYHVVMTIAGGYGSGPEWHPGRFDECGVCRGQRASKPLADGASDAGSGANATSASSGPTC